MVFPPVPVYLDPSNWQQQLPNQQAQGVAGNERPQLPPLPPPPPPHVSGGATGAGSIRPGSMTDRARLAKIPQPEAGLKCPRCESTNTKFCYFNNYSLTQPRHFCKTCRRYWTRGGALRNVPVGGGCRRNKKSKSSQSNQSSGSSKASSGNNSSNDGSRMSIGSTSPISSSIISHNLPQHHPTQLPFMTPLHNLTQFHVGNIGLNFSGIGSGQAHDMGFQIGSNSGLISNAILSTGGGQQVPFFDPQPPPNTGLFPFQHQIGSHVEATPSSTGSRVSDHVASVKMEDSQGGLNLSRQLLGVPENSQYWPGGGSTWTDLSGLNSSSTSHLL